MEVNPNCDRGNILLDRGNKNQAEAGSTLQISGHVQHAPLQYEVTLISGGLLTHSWMHKTNMQIIHTDAHKTKIWLKRTRFNI